MFENEAAAMSGEDQGAVAASAQAEIAQSNESANAAVDAATSAGQSADKKSGAQLLREAFGRKNETDAQTADVAPAAEGDTHAAAQNSADTVPNGENETAGAAVEASHGTDTAQKKNQSKEENAAFAAARRKAETEYARKLEGERASLNALIGDLGLVDPITGKKIDTVESLRSFQSERAKTRVSEVAKKAGLSEEDLSALIASHPDVAAAKELREQLEADKQQATREKMQVQLDSDIREISRVNPGVKNFEDLRRLDRYDQIYDYVTKKGLSLLEGYRLAYMDDIMGKREARSAAAARAQVLSKEHLSPARSVSEGDSEVSSAEIAAARKWGSFSKKSDAEIAALIRRTRR